MVSTSGAILFFDRLVKKATQRDRIGRTGCKAFGRKAIDQNFFGTEFVDNRTAATFSQRLGVDQVEFGADHKFGNVFVDKLFAVIFAELGRQQRQIGR